MTTVNRLKAETLPEIASPTPSVSRVSRRIKPTVPVLLLGGQEQPIPTVTNLAKHGITVDLTGDTYCWGLHSKYVRNTYRVPDGQDVYAYWERLLLTPGRPELQGHVIIALNDVAIEFVLKHYADLRKRYIIEEFDPDLKAAMLNKQRTLELAAQTGVPAPRYWKLEKIEDLQEIEAEITFPVMVKPVYAHLFIQAFGKKLVIIEKDFSELRENARKALDKGLEILIVEVIPGGDDQLSSLYSYVDDNGTHLFQYTKRIWRRFPKNSGQATLHETEWLPETAALGRRFLDGIGWRGIANIEFKRDPRDGQLKLIELNSRITQAQRLLVASGLSLELITYCRLTGQPVPQWEGYKQGLRLWLPLRDFRSFLELRRLGELTFFGWLRSILRPGIIFSMPVWEDRGPLWAFLRHTARHHLGRLIRSRRRQH